jgi:hypothetical protein
LTHHSGTIDAEGVSVAGESHDQQHQEETTDTTEHVDNEVAFHVSLALELIQSLAKRQFIMALAALRTYPST